MTQLLKVLPISSLMKYTSEVKKGILLDFQSFAIIVHYLIYIFSDFLLLICRDLLKTRPDLRVILMSATIDSNLFSDYFGGAPVITIPGRIFPVEKLFLEDILEKVDYEHDEGSKNWRPPSKLAERLAEKGGDNLPPADDSASDVDLVPCQV